ncbi:MAG: hypothetical protein ABI910_18055 [Gemmatimonadota bacterium]
MAKRKDAEKGTVPRPTAKGGAAPRMVSVASVITTGDVGDHVALLRGRRVRSMLVTKAMVGRSFGAAVAAASRSRGAARAYALLKQSQRNRASVARSDGSAHSASQPVGAAQPATSGYGFSHARGSVARGGMILQEILVPTVHHGALRMRVTADGTVRLIERQPTARTVPVSAPARESSAAAVAAEDFTTAQMLEAGLLAFWEIADRWKLSNTEQCAMLQVSDSTRLRWTKTMPTEGDALADRLQLVLLTYQRANELAGSESEAAALVRREGSALNADSPQQTILEMLSVASILEMHRHYQRLEAEVAAW